MCTTGHVGRIPLEDTDVAHRDERRFVGAPGNSALIVAHMGPMLDGIRVAIAGFLNVRGGIGHRTQLFQGKTRRSETKGKCDVPHFDGRRLGLADQLHFAIDAIHRLPEGRRTNHFLHFPNLHGEVWNAECPFDDELRCQRADLHAPLRGLRSYSARSRPGISAVVPANTFDLVKRLVQILIEQAGGLWVQQFLFGGQMHDRHDLAVVTHLGFVVRRFDDLSLRGQIRVRWTFHHLVHAIAKRRDIFRDEDPRVAHTLHGQFLAARHWHDGRGIRVLISGNPHGIRSIPARQIEHDQPTIGWRRSLRQRPRGRLKRLIAVLSGAAREVTLEPPRQLHRVVVFVVRQIIFGRRSRFRLESGNAPRVFAVQQ